MKLQEIDKAVYRKRLNMVIIGFIVALALLSLAFGSALISLFTSSSTVAISDIATNEPVNNFKYNFVGVVLALLVCAGLLNQLKSTLLFKEVYYVWQIKQIQNSIYRKLKNIKKAAFTQHDKTAMIILNYYYVSLEQIYVLDDNTLTMSSVQKNIDELKSLLSELDIDVNTEQFSQQMVTTY